MGKIVKVGIIGMGRAGEKMHAVEIAKCPDKFVVAAVCDLDAERAAEMGKKYNCPYYTDYKELLKAHQVELIVVATYSLTHVDIAIEALEAGYSVIIEKPLTVDYAKALQLREVAVRYPGKLFCRQNRRFEPAFQHVLEVIASGILGDIRIIKLRRNSFSRRNDWQTLKANAGGQLSNWAPHILDQALQFLNYKVDSIWSNLQRIAALGDADDSVKILLTGNGGMLVDIEIIGGAALPSNVCEVYGTRGALSITPNEEDMVLRYIDPEYELKDFPVMEGHPDGFAFADNATIPWIRKTIMVAPSNHYNLHSFYPAVYDTMRNCIPFPVTVEQAVEVVRIVAQVRKQNPQFM